MSARHHLPSDASTLGVRGIILCYASSSRWVVTVRNTTQTLTRGWVTTQAYQKPSTRPLGLHSAPPAVFTCIKWHLPRNGQHLPVLSSSEWRSRSSQTTTYCRRRAERPVVYWRNLDLDIVVEEPAEYTDLNPTYPTHIRHAMGPAPN